MMKPLVRTLSLLCCLAPAYLEAQERFQTGNLSWTPVVTLNDAGLDTNVYDEPTNPKRDHLAIVSPQVDGKLALGSGTFSFGGAADFVYFRRYTDERSINRRGSVSFEVPLSRIRPFGGGSYLNTHDRYNSEIDVRARRTDRELHAGLGVSLTSRAVVEFVGRRSDSRFEQGETFRGVALAARFNRDTTGGAARVRYDVTPLTTFTLEASAFRDDFVLSPEFNTDNLRVEGGFLFAPDAVLKGRALVGYHKLEPRGVNAAGYDGLVTTVEIGYVLLGRTRFDVRVTRDTSQSLEAQPFFVRTIYGGEVVHNLVGPLDVIARASREGLSYDSLPDRLLTAHTVELNRYGGALAVRAAERVRFTVNYEFSERLSAVLPDRQYDRERVYTTISYGF
jgi:hypothetical protein